MFAHYFRLLLNERRAYIDCLRTIQQHQAGLASDIAPGGGGSSGGGSGSATGEGGAAMSTSTTLMAALGGGAASSGSSGGGGLKRALVTSGVLDAALPAPTLDADTSIEGILGAAVRAAVPTHAQLLPEEQVGLPRLSSSSRQLCFGPWKEATGRRLGHSGHVSRNRNSLSQLPG